MFCVSLDSGVKLARGDSSDRMLSDMVRDQHHHLRHAEKESIRGHPYMMSALRGGGGVSPKEDVVREVA